MFYRVPGELKPMYLDWESPVYVEMFAAAARRAASKRGEIAMIEMLPAPEQSWLADREGKPYGCELHIVAVERSVARGARITGP